jgi:hypothetical protein
MACILDTEYTSTKSGNGGNTIALKCTRSGILSLAMQKQYKLGDLHVKVVNKGTGLKEVNTSTLYGIVSIGGRC